MVRKRRPVSSRSSSSKLHAIVPCEDESGCRRSAKAVRHSSFTMRYCLFKVNGTYCNKAFHFATRKKKEIFYQIDEIIFFSLKHQHILQTFTFSVFEIPGRSRKVTSTSVSVIFTTTVSILLEKFFSRRWPR